MIGRLYIAATLSVFASVAIAQTASAPSVAAPTSTPAAKGKLTAFDVVSIKPARPDESEHWHYGFGPSGYSATGVPLAWVIDQAYFAFNMGGKDAVTGVGGTS